MYRVDARLVQLAIAELRRVVGEPSVEGTLGNETYTFEAVDLTAVFVREDKVRLQGLTFKVFDKYFFVGADLAIYLTNEEGQALELDDEDFCDALQKYLQWRVLMLKKFSI